MMGEHAHGFGRELEIERLSGAQAPFMWKTKIYFVKCRVGCPLAPTENSI
jgi:hypothetical protein